MIPFAESIRPHFIIRLNIDQTRVAHWKSSPDHADKLKRQLVRFDAAKSPQGMNVPGWNACKRNAEIAGRYFPYLKFSKMPSQIVKDFVQYAEIPAQPGSRACRLRAALCKSQLRESK